MSTFGALILAGGKSSRMGRDKANLRINGVTLLERLVRLVSPLVSETIVMLAEGQVPLFSGDLVGQVRVGRDSVAERGPLQGLADACPLFSFDVDSIFVLTCDLPYLTLKGLETLKRVYLREEKIVCVREGGFVNPLIAIYPRSDLESARKLISEGRRSCLALLDIASYRCVSVDSNHSRVYRNINTPEEYEEAVKTLVK